MGTIGVDALKPGMVLAAPLRSPQGRVLLPQGATLSEKHLKACKIWGIVEAEVQDNGNSSQDASQPQGSPSADNLPDDIHAEAVRVSKRFFQRHPEDDPYSHRLRQEYARRKAQQFAATGGPPAERPNIADLPMCDPCEPLRLSDVIGEEISLASLPDIFTKIVEAIKDPLSSSNYLAHIISRDTSLTAKLLKAVNTPYYGFSGKIDTLSRALTMVGTDRLVSLAMGISILSAFKDIPGDVLNMAGFWRHSVACGVAARLLGAQVDPRNEERYFVAGLLHDIGRLVMLRNHPEHARSALLHGETPDRPLHINERERWGFHHGSLAGGLLKAWKLPQPLYHAVRLHHTPIPEDVDRGPAIVHLADLMAHAMDAGHSGSKLAPAICPEAVAGLGLSVNALSPVFRQADIQIEECMRAFFHD